MVGRYALVEDLDTQLGRFMKQLNAELMENTLVISLQTMDPTPAGIKKMGRLTNSITPDFQKAKAAWKEHLPFLWQWKGVFEEGRDISKLTVIDFFPTFMELAGIKPVASTPKYEGRCCCLSSVIPNTNGLIAICTSIQANGNPKTM